MDETDRSARQFGRRAFIRTLGKTILAAPLGTGLAVMPSGIHQAFASPDSVRAAMRKHIGDRVPQKGKITFDVSNIAENGANVLIGVDVESPMVLGDFVRAIHLFAEGNPNPEVASYYFTPQSGKAAIITRIRLARSQKIIGIAETSDGSIYMTEMKIKVTIGGCGGTLQKISSGN